jgi:predicted Zn-dependent protease
MVPARRLPTTVIAAEAGYVHIAGAALLLIGLCVFALFLYCSAEEQTVPVTGRTQKVAMSEKDQAKLGADAYAQVLNQSASEIVSSGPEAEMVQRVGQRIAAVADDPGYDWQFTLLEDPQVNAWCLPGGKVAVYSGILAVTQDENGLAVVMAHEIAHAIAQHGAERMLQEELTQVGLTAVSTTLGGLSTQAQGAVLALFGAGAQYGVLLPFSRDMESEADHIGLIYMARAGYDPQAAVALWQRMADLDSGSNVPEYASDHPSDETRIKDLQKWMPEAEKEYQKALAAAETD